MYAACFRPCFLEGSAVGPGQRCNGAPDYADYTCGAHGGSGLPGSNTCFDILPLPGAVPRPLRYGDAVLVRDGVIFGGLYLNATVARFTADLGKAPEAAAARAMAWTLVNPANITSLAVFTGGAFSLRPGFGVPPPSPPRAGRTIYVSHSENLGMMQRTNGTIRASTDGGITWPHMFQVTRDPAGSGGMAKAGLVFDRQAFGYSCLTALPVHSQFQSGGYFGLLWETSTTDCQTTDASCAVKFSVIPQICEAGGPRGACDVWHNSPVLDR